MIRVLPSQTAVDVSGTAPLEGIKLTKRDHWIALKFHRPRKVIYSAKLELSGRVDMDAHAGDLLCLLCMGDYWQETGRVVA